METFHLNLCMLRAQLECSSPARAHSFTRPVFCLQGHNLLSFPGWESVLTASCSQLDSCVQSLSGVRLFATPWTVARQAPLSMGILQARILEWVAISSPRGTFPPRDWTRASCVADRFFTAGATRGALESRLFLSIPHIYAPASLCWSHHADTIVWVGCFYWRFLWGGVITHLCALRRYRNALDKENIQ